jgi:hypothetical protein
MASALKRPREKDLARFTTAAIGGDTVGLYLAKGWSLAICCKACPRLVEWTPPELQRRFGDRPGLRIATIAERLACAGEGGCGSDEVAVFPHAYDGTWPITPAGGT